MNEGEGIRSTIEEIAKELVTPEIIVVDAKSIDGTPQIAASLGAKVVTQFGKGKGKAIAQILQHMKKDTKWVVITDGDYTYPATYVPYMIKILERSPNVGMVTGARLSPKGFFSGKLRLFLTGEISTKRLFHYLRHYLQHQALILLHRILNGVTLEDPTTGLRVMKYDCAKDFQPKAEGFDIEVEINHYVRRKGYRIHELPIETRLRLGADKLRYSKHGITILKRIMIMAGEDVVSWLKSL